MQEQMEVSLKEMLDFREKKVRLVENLRNEFADCILVSLGLNIPGPGKNNEEIFSVFMRAEKSLNKLLTEKKYKINKETIISEKAGNIAVFSLKTKAAEEVKAGLIDLEEGSGIGRLYDIDVYRPDGFQVSRGDIGKEERKCLICGKSAKVCGRSREHGVEELVKRTKEIISESLLCI